MTREEILVELEASRERILAAEQGLAAMRRDRDFLLQDAVDMGIKQTTICRAAGVTRAWLWKLRQPPEA